MKIITNYNNNHKDRLLNLFKSADEVKIAVAFLKNSGLNVLLKSIKQNLKTGGKVKIYCGLSFFQTEPIALKKLLELESKYENFKLKVIDPIHGTFHPKLYFFRKANSVTLVVGSANLTLGGLENNDEISIQSEYLKKNEIQTELNNYFNHLNDKSYPIFLKASLDKYELKYNKRKKEKSKEETEINDELNKLPNYTAEHNRRIADHLGLYNYLENMSVDEYNERHNNYIKAKKQILSISKEKLSKSEFEQHYSNLISLFSSSGLQRKKSEVIHNHKSVTKLFSDILKTIKNDNFENYLLEIKKIPGLGINILTEILCTLAPNNYPIINNRSVGALMHLGFNIKKEPSIYKYKDYLQFIEIAKNIIKEHQLENFSQLDHLLHAIHEWNKIVEKFNGVIPQTSNVFIKPIGYAEKPYPKTPFPKGVSHVDFTNRASAESIKPNDFVIVYGVGTTKIITIAKAMSNIWQRVQYDVNNPPTQRIWPKSVWHLNLTPKFAQVWWKFNFEINPLVQEYLNQNNANKITAVNTTTLGALNRGCDKIQLNKNFGEFLVNKIFAVETEIL